MPVLRINEDELNLVANVLAVINPGRVSAEGMRAMVTREVQPGQVTVLSTGGWVASMYLAHDGATVVRFSLSAYSVALHLNGGVSPYKDDARINYEEAV